jgi:hypothetical protein
MSQAVEDFGDIIIGDLSESCQQGEFVARQPGKTQGLYARVPWQTQQKRMTHGVQSKCQNGSTTSQRQLRVQSKVVRVTQARSRALGAVDLDLEFFLEADGASQGRNAERGSNKGSRI